MNAHRSTLAALATSSAIALLAACGSATTNRPPVGQGQLAVSLVDSPNPTAEKVTVKITGVTAHSTSAGWVSIATFADPLVVDLLTLQSSAASLGLANLPPGTITQIRLMVAPD